MSNGLLPVAEFGSLIETQGNIYENRRGVEIDFIEEISARFRIWDKSPTSFDLYVELPAEDFMSALNIQSWADVEAIDEAVLWEQYRLGNGYVWASMEYLGETDLRFRLMKENTIIIGEKLKYYDEVVELIDDVDGLRAYVRDHIKQLYIAAEQL